MATTSGEGRPPRVGVATAGSLGRFSVLGGWGKEGLHSRKSGVALLSLSVLIPWVAPVSLHPQDQGGRFRVGRGDCCLLRTGCFWLSCCGEPFAGEVELSVTSHFPI